tara:strand:+ start:4248 stop:5345 length:1098 start_codon:yes stop_codon:yes gene_type:complete
MGLDISQINQVKQEAASQRDADQNKGKGGGNQSYLENFVLMPEGEGYVDLHICPPAADNPHPIMTGGLVMPSRIHRFGVKGRDLRNFHCLREFHPGGKWRKPADGSSDCPGCLYYSHLWKLSEELEGDEQEEMQNRARKFRPFPRYYFNAIEVGRSDGESDMGKVKIFSCGQTVYDKVVLALAGNEKKDPLGDVTDFGPQGRILRVEKTMIGQGRSAYAKYDDTDFFRPEALGTPEEVENWMGNLHDLHALRRILPYEELKKKLQIHLGVVEPDFGDDNFNPSDYEVANEAVKHNTSTATTVAVKAEVPATEEPKAEVQATVASVETKEEAPVAVKEEKKDERKDAGEFLLEDEFLQELQDMPDE